jgi:hypothetical protein
MTRVFDTPISRVRHHRAAVGMCAYGLRPVPEIQFADYIYPGLDQLVSEAARLRYRSAGEFIAPMTVRSPFGGGIFGGQTHSQSPEAMFTHVCGIKTVVPSTPHDAKGLLIAAIEDNDPVVFFEPKRIYNGPFDGYYDRPTRPWKDHPDAVVPEGYYSIPLGKARIVREGSALTVLAYGTMVHVAEAVCREKGVDAEIIDFAHAGPARHRGRSRPRWPRPAGAWSCTRRREPLGSAPSSPRLCRSAVLPPRSAGRTRHRIRHPLSAQPRMGLFPRADPCRRGDRQAAGGLRDGQASYPACRTSAKASPGPRSCMACEAGRRGQGRRPAGDLMTQGHVEMESRSGNGSRVAGEVGDVIAIGSAAGVLENQGGRGGGTVARPWSRRPRGARRASGCDRGEEAG